MSWVAAGLSSVGWSYLYPDGDNGLTRGLATLPEVHPRTFCGKGWKTSKVTWWWCTAIWKWCTVWTSPWGEHRTYPWKFELIVKFSLSSLSPKFHLSVFWLVFRLPWSCFVYYVAFLYCFLIVLFKLLALAKFSSASEVTTVWCYNKSIIIIIIIKSVAHLSQPLVSQEIICTKTRLESVLYCLYCNLLSTVPFNWMYQFNLPWHDVVSLLVLIMLLNINQLALMQTAAAAAAAAIIIIIKCTD